MSVTSDPDTTRAAFIDLYETVYFAFVLFHNLKLLCWSKWKAHFQQPDQTSSTPPDSTGGKLRGGVGWERGARSGASLHHVTMLGTTVDLAEF